MAPLPASMTLTTLLVPDHTHLTTGIVCRKAHWRAPHTGTILHRNPPQTTLDIHLSTTMCPLEVLLEDPIQGWRMGSPIIMRGAMESPPMNGTVAPSREG